jgi:hypothetical protein
MIYSSVWGNKISKITPRTFENMSRLEYLDQQENMIEHLVTDVFSGLVKLKRIWILDE